MVSHEPLAGYDCTQLTCTSPLYFSIFSSLLESRAREAQIGVSILGAAGKAGRWLGLQRAAWAYKVGSWEITNA